LDNIEKIIPRSALNGVLTQSVVGEGSSFADSGTRQKREARYAQGVVEIL